MKAWFYGMACVSPFLSLAGWAARKCPGTWAALFAERCGFYPPFSGEASLWVHAASAGEVRSVSALIRKFRASFPETPVVLTATSATGLKVAEEELQGVFSFSAPIDVPGAVERAFRTFRPKLLLVAETELWPVLFSEAKRRGVPLWIVNGRLSDRSFPIYRKVSWLFRSILKNVNRGFVQTKKDEQRFLTLGIPRDRLCVVGQMKYDLKKPSIEKTRNLRNAIGVRRGEVWFVFASLREGEEKLLEIIPAFLKHRPKARFLVAPRYLSFLPKLEEVLKRFGLHAARRSGKISGEKVILLDTLGELLAFFPLARGAFVGGTWTAGVGGHNVLEPALGGVPTAFGPHYANVAEAAEALMQNGAGVCIQDPADLKVFWESLCVEKVFQEKRRKIRRVLDELSGATEKTFESLKTFWRVKH